MNGYRFHNFAVRAFVVLLLVVIVQSCANVVIGTSGLPVYGTRTAIASRPATAAVENTEELEYPPSLPNLNLDSDSTMIMEKIRWSHTTWQTLWAEGLDPWMAPKGSGKGQGEIRSQAWVSQSGPSLREIYGSPDEGPSFLQVMHDGVLLRLAPGGGFRDISQAPEFVVSPYIPVVGIPAEEARHPLSRVLQTALAYLLFPFPVSTRDATFKGIEVETIAGHQALVVDVYEVYMDSVVRTDRLWVDVERGILLRSQYFGKSGGEQPLTDTQLTAVVYDPPIPQGCFSLELEEIPGFEKPPAAGGPGSTTYGSVQLSPGMGAVDLRSGPGLHFDVIGQLNEGVEIEVIGTTGWRDWWQLSFDGEPAWVFASLVEFSGDPSVIPVVDGDVPVPVSGADIDIERAVKVVEAFMGKSDLLLSLIDVSAMPNANLRPGWQLTDDSGRLYWLDVETYQLVQIEPYPINHTDSTSPKSIEELRRIARELALEHSIIFADSEEGLDYSESDKLGQNFFFEWEDRSRPWRFMPPRLQVGLTSGGQLLSWLNTLDLYE
jgi:hypothetical protein